MSNRFYRTSCVVTSFTRQTYLFFLQSIIFKKRNFFLLMLISTVINLTDCPRALKSNSGFVTNTQLWYITAINYLSNVFITPLVTSVDSLWIITSHNLGVYGDCLSICLTTWLSVTLAFIHFSRELLIQWWWNWKLQKAYLIVKLGWDIPYSPNLGVIGGICSPVCISILPMYTVDAGHGEGLVCEWWLKVYVKVLTLGPGGPSLPAMPSWPVKPCIEREQTSTIRRKRNALEVTANTFN